MFCSSKNLIVISYRFLSFAIFLPFLSCQVFQLPGTLDEISELFAALARFFYLSIRYLKPLTDYELSIKSIRARYARGHYPITQDTLQKVLHFKLENLPKLVFSANSFMSALC